jgi:hypothetical protein
MLKNCYYPAGETQQYINLQCWDKGEEEWGSRKVNIFEDVVLEG